MRNFTFDSDRYVLGGQEHPPGITNSLTQGCSLFSRQYEESVTTDEAAIAQAEKNISDLRRDAKPGNVVGATLYYNDRIVKHFKDE